MVPELGSFQDGIGNSYTENRERWKKSRLLQVGRWQVEKTRELQYKTHLDQTQNKHISMLTCQNLKCLYRSLNAVGSCIASRWAQHTAVPGYAPETALTLRTGDIPSSREGDKGLLLSYCLGPV